jgi:alkaline phosphatase
MTASRIYAVGESGELPIDKFPETAFVKTFSNDAQVTDSAPSMSAYMTGVKMNNDVISMSQDTAAFDGSGNAYFTAAADSTCPKNNGTPVTTLLELFKASGRGTGVVTTTRITHATPAATYSHICNRDGENAIAAQAVPGGVGYNTALGSDGVDVLLGGGSRHFLPNTTSAGMRTDGRDLTAEMKAKGYTYVTTGTALAGVPSSTGKLLGLFTKSHMDFDLDRTDNMLDQPSLSAMTSKALDVLSQKNGGFFLMVEGGRIDQALHPTNARYALQDAKAFNDAIQTAMDKMATIDPGLANTLIVVTADHDHTMVMNGYAALTGKTIDAAHPGVLGLMRNFTDAQNTDGSQKDLATVTPANDGDGKPFTTLVFGNGENRIAGGRASMTALTDATVFNKAYHQEAAIPTSAGNETHGGADVFLGAMGLGADNFHGVMDNTKVFTLCKKALGL